MIMNRDFKKFFAKLFLLAVVVPVAFASLATFGVFFVGSQYQEGYNASLIDKVARLKSIHEPKIILAGNSNLSFGMNSPMLQEAINMPVVNLGLHGGLGNAFHENIAKINLNSGDIVIVCHSNYSDDHTISNVPLAWITVEYHKDLWEIIRPQDYLDMLQAWPGYWWKSLVKKLFPEKKDADESAYSRSAFNEYGDVERKPDDKRATKEGIIKKAIENKIKVPDINDTCIKRLNELNRYVTERGAVMLVAGYPITSGDFTPPREDYYTFTRELSARLSCDVI